MNSTDSISLLGKIAEDLRVCAPSPNAFSRICAALFSRSFHVLLLYRIGHLCAGHKLTKPLLHPLRWSMGAVSGCEISFQSRVGRRLILPHPVMVIVGEGAVIGDDVTLYHGVTLGRRDRDIAAYPNIGSNSVVYALSSLLGGITLGEGATVGAHSLVLRDVPAGATALGSPARVLQTGEPSGKITPTPERVGMLPATQARG